MKTPGLALLRLTPLLAIALAGSFPGCAGTETTNPFKSFEGSECKMHLLGADVDVSQTALSSDKEHDGGTPGTPTTDEVFDAGGDSDAPASIVSCVSYEQDGDMLRITTTNFSAPCGVMSWQGDTHFEGDTLVVQSKNASEGCSIARCGSCIYDFEHTLTGAPQGKSLPVRIEVGECAEAGSDSAINRHITKLTLPLDHEAKGTLCLDKTQKWRPM